MPQNKVLKSISCNHCWEKRNLTEFYMWGLFQKITANVAVGKKYPTMMHFLRKLFAKTAVQHCTVAYRCTVVYKRLRKYGSYHNVSRNCAKYQTYCFSLKWPKLKLYSSSYVFDINQANWKNNFLINLSLWYTLHIDKICKKVEISNNLNAMSNWKWNKNKLLPLI